MRATEAERRSARITRRGRVRERAGRTTDTSTATKSKSRRRGSEGGREGGRRGEVGAVRSHGSAATGKQTSEPPRGHAYSCARVRVSHLCV